MRSERGQASFEWIAIVLVVAIVLTAAARIARPHEDHALAATLVHSLAGRSAQVMDTRSEKRNEAPPPRLEALTAPPLPPSRGPAQRGLRQPIGRPLLEWARRRIGHELAGPLRRELPGLLREGARRAWRRAWFACLVYERARWAVLHPESRSHEYELPPSEALRMANDCISPVDLVRDWPLLNGR